MADAATDLRRGSSRPDTPFGDTSPARFPRLLPAQADMPRGAQVAFKDPMTHRFMRVAPRIALCCVLHRCRSPEIRCSQLSVVYVAQSHSARTHISQ